MVLVPANMAEPLDRAFTALRKDVGDDLFEFVRTELGYSKDAPIEKYFAGEQIDALSLAIWNFQNGGALIIGDQTGIGKGCVAAGLIVYAINNGLIPVFFTEKSDLYGTMLNSDLADIGMIDKVKPIMPNNDLNIGVVKRLGLAHGKEVFESLESTGELPDGHNAIFCTYSQIMADSQTASAKAKAKALQQKILLPHKYRHGAFSTLCLLR